MSVSHGDGVSDSQAAGVLIVDKPAGPTSHDVVAVARRALGSRKVGHLGTLDPLATGVLPLVVGRATRLAPLFAGASKQYDAVVRLGLATNTCDVGGVVVGGSEAGGGAPGPPPSPEAVTAAAASFAGSFEQRPPAVSAKKIAGVRAYDLARRARPVELPPVRVTVDTLDVLSIDGLRVRLRIACSSGFYVRALARDLGEALGCGGCLEALRRERHGRFTLEDAAPLDRVVDEGAAAAARLVPPEDLLPELPGVVVTPRGARRAAHGNPLGPADLVTAGSGAGGGPGSAFDTDWLRDGGGTAGSGAGGGSGRSSSRAANADLVTAGGGGAEAGRRRVRVLDGGGRLLAIAEPLAGGVLHPRIVLV